MLPLVVVYGLGLLYASAEARSGVDVISQGLLGILGLRGYVGAIGVTTLLVIGVASRRLDGRLGRHALLAGPVAVEAGLYGLFLGAGILEFMDWRGLLGPLLIDATTFEHVVMSAGAGLCEESLFRLLLLPATTAVLVRGLAMPRPIALAVAVAATSLLFAGAHLLGGEAWDPFAFTYRTLAGCVFAGLFLTRGFAVATWSHATYDFFVLSGLNA